MVQGFASCTLSVHPHKPRQISAVEEYQRVSIALYNLVVDPMIPYLLEPWKFPKAAELDAITFKSW